MGGVYSTGTIQTVSGIVWFTVLSWNSQNILVIPRSCFISLNSNKTEVIKKVTRWNTDTAIVCCSIILEIISSAQTNIKSSYSKKSVLLSGGNILQNPLWMRLRFSLLLYRCTSWLNIQCDGKMKLGNDLFGHGQTSWILMYSMTLKPSHVYFWGPFGGNATMRETQNQHIITFKVFGDYLSEQLCIYTFSICIATLAFMQNGVSGIRWMSTTVSSWLLNVSVDCCLLTEWKH